MKRENKKLIGLIAFLLFLLIFFLTILCTLEYFSLKSTINDCNKQFGEGKWTFEENANYLSCKHYHSHEFRECFENGIKIDCKR